MSVIKVLKFKLSITSLSLVGYFDNNILIIIFYHKHELSSLGSFFCTQTIHNTTNNLKPSTIKENDPFYPIPQTNITLQIQNKTFLT
jgi:hypothetical protein